MNLHLLLTFTLIQSLLFVAPVFASEPLPSLKFAEQIDANLAGFQVQKRSLQGISAEGATVLAWRDGRTIRKIAIEALGERGKRLADFYFERGKLRLARIRVIDYEADITESLAGKELKSSVVEDHQLLFSGGRLRIWLVGGKKVGNHDKRWQSMQQYTLAEAREFVSFMQRSPPTGKDCHWVCLQQNGAGCRRAECQ